MNKIYHGLNTVQLKVRRRDVLNFLCFIVALFICLLSNYLYYIILYNEPSLLLYSHCSHIYFGVGCNGVGRGARCKVIPSRCSGGFG